jgi:hypothetical protein
MVFYKSVKMAADHDIPGTKAVYRTGRTRSLRARTLQLQANRDIPKVPAIQSGGELFLFRGRLPEF